MRITDLLDKRSIQLAAAPTDKEHALKQPIRNRYLPEKKNQQQASEKGLQFLMVNAMR